MAGAEDKPAFTLVAAVPEAEHLTTVVVLRAAPDAATIFPEHPHIEGRVAIVLEVEGAPPPRPRARANICQPRARAALPATETSTATHEALL